jgi:hypothetical protein
MDNASYHSMIREKIPSRKNKEGGRNCLVGNKKY